GILLTDQRSISHEPLCRFIAAISTLWRSRLTDVIFPYAIAIRGARPLRSSTLTRHVWSAGSNARRWTVSATSPSMEAVAELPRSLADPTEPQRSAGGSWRRTDATRMPGRFRREAWLVGFPRTAASWPCYADIW